MDKSRRIQQFSMALNEVFEVLDYGEHKYGDDKDWLNRADLKDIKAALRHIGRFDEVDSDTNCSHIAHAICRLLFVLERKKKNEIKCFSL